MTNLLISLCSHRSLVSIFGRGLPRLERGSFGHNVLVMFAGTALGQFSSVLLAPLLTRLYSPASFGILGVFSSVVTVLSVVATLRFEMAIPLARTEEDADSLLGLCFFTLGLTTSIFAALLGVLSASGRQDALLGALAPYRWWLPVGFFCIGTYQTMIFYATRHKAFPAIARTKIYQGLAGPLSQGMLGLLGFGAGGLIAGFIAGQSTGSGMLASRLNASPHALRGRITVARMRALASRFRRFPLVSSWSGLINSAGTGCLLIVIPMIYSSAIAGFIFLTDRIIGRPLLIISTSILQVYVGEVSESASSDPAALKRRFLRLAFHQFCTVSAWLVVVNLAAPFAFPLAFGPQWQGAVPYLHVLSIAYLPQMVMHALIHTLQVLERQTLSALWESGRLAAILCGFLASYLLHLPPLEAMLIYSLTQGLAQIVLFFLMYRSIQSLQPEKTHA